MATTSARPISIDRKLGEFRVNLPQCLECRHGHLSELLIGSGGPLVQFRVGTTKPGNSHIIKISCLKTEC